MHAASGVCAHPGRVHDFDATNIILIPPANYLSPSIYDTDGGISKSLSGKYIHRRYHPAWMNKIKYGVFGRDADGICIVQAGFPCPCP